MKDSTPSHYYHRINANSAEPFTNAHVQDFDGDPHDEFARLRSLLTHRRAMPNGKWDHGDENLYLGSNIFTLWCDDGELRELTVFVIENGGANLLLPNHRANALIDAGRFTSKDRIEFNHGRNQSLKEHYGCNFVWGDVVCKIPIDTAGPDHTVYNNNPLRYMLETREPTSEMVNAHGEEMARNKLVTTRKMDVVASINAPGNPIWKDTTYLLAPKNCTNYEFKILLSMWIESDDLDRIFKNVEDPVQYATHLQYTREWAALVPADRDLIWSLPQTPSGRDSIGWTDYGAEVPLDIMFETVFGNRQKTPQRLELLRAMKNWEAPPEKRRDLLSVDFAFGRHHTSIGVVRNVPLHREAFQAMTQSEEGDDRVQLASTRAETKRIGSVIMKAVVMMLIDSTHQAAKCESCGKQANGMKGFVCFKPNKNNDGGRFIASDEWFHCDSMTCQDQVEFNSKRGEEREEASELRAGDESVMLVAVPGVNSEVSDDSASLLEIANSEMGPGAAIATDLGNRLNTVRLDYTKAVFKFESIDDLIKLRVPYKKLTSVDPDLKFPGYWSLERARAAGFIRSEESDEKRNKYIRQMTDSAVAEVFKDHNLTCSVCLDAAPTGCAFPITYIGNLDGSKGTFVPSSEERWVCESQHCLARASKGVRKDMKKMGFGGVCNHCGVQDERGNYPCAGCRKGYYCSKTCQRADWPHHKAMCKSIQKLNSKREKEKRQGRL